MPLLRQFYVIHTDLLRRYCRVTIGKHAKFNCVTIYLAVPEWDKDVSLLMIVKAKNCYGAITWKWRFFWNVFVLHTVNVLINVVYIIRLFFIKLGCRKNLFPRKTRLKISRLINGNNKNCKVVENVYYYDITVNLGIVTTKHIGKENIIVS